MSFLHERLASKIVVCFHLALPSYNSSNVVNMIKPSDIAPLHDFYDFDVYTNQCEYGPDKPCNSPISCAWQLHLDVNN